MFCNVKNRKRIGLLDMALKRVNIIICVVCDFNCYFNWRLYLSIYKIGANVIGEQARPA